MLVQSIANYSVMFGRYSSFIGTNDLLCCDRYRAVQWHYIDQLSNDTVPNHTFLQPTTKLYLFTNELKLRDDFRCFRSKMCFRTFSTLPLKLISNPEHIKYFSFKYWHFNGLSDIQKSTAGSLSDFIAILEMGNYACLHCFSLANSSVRLLITCAHPDYMHFF